MWVAFVITLLSRSLVVFHAFFHMMIPTNPPNCTMDEAKVLSSAAFGLEFTFRFVTSPFEASLWGDLYRASVLGWMGHVGPLPLLLWHSG